VADAVPTTFASTLRTRRKALGLSQETLARLVGVNVQTISRLERGLIKEHCPRIDTLCHLATAIDVPIETLSALACAALK
jgi:transcriptional regulator with XRE-family HTH domain